MSDILCANCGGSLGVGEQHGEEWICAACAPSCRHCHAVERRRAWEAANAALVSLAGAFDRAGVASQDAAAAFECLAGYLADQEPE
jgi:hypothetical protein